LFARAARACEAIDHRPTTIMPSFAAGASIDGMSVRR
jgi:hypothetical protein